MAGVRKWEFKSKFRANAYGWSGSRLAIDRLKAAVAEIKSVAKLDPVMAGDGVVSLAERIWPAFQGIDSSSGALGSAVFRTLEELIPLLIAAPADPATRRKWLRRLFEAVQNDGVDYLSPLEDRWGEIAQYPELLNEYANLMIGMVRRAWADHKTFSHVTGTSICLSCLLELGRYGDLQELLAIPRIKFWPRHKFGAQALVRQGLGSRDRLCRGCSGPDKSRQPRNFNRSVLRNCPDRAGAFGRGVSGLRPACRAGHHESRCLPLSTAVYRSLLRTYPDRDRRQMLLDLIQSRGDKGKWFAAAKDAGFFDIAIECAAAYDAEPSTLVRAARDFQSREPKFAATVALLALSSCLNGGGYDPQPAEATDATKYLLAASRELAALDWAVDELGKLTEQRCAPGRERFQLAIKAAVSRWLQDAPNPEGSIK